MTAFRLRFAADALHSGEVIAYPTEAVYGLGCDPLNPDAVQRLLAIKQRDIDKGLILIASEFDQLRPFILPLPETARKQVEASWPGPCTWLCPATAATPAWIRGQHSSIAVRVTAHPLAAALCAAFGGPIVSTSANTSARPPARSALQARLRCPGVDRIVPGCTGGQSKPTTIRDVLTGTTLRLG